MFTDATIKEQESYWPVICPYCHNKMKHERVVISPSTFTSPSAHHQYFCECGACTPEGTTLAEAYDLAFAYNHKLIEAKNFEYQRGFEDGYKSGRERGHGFSY